MKKQIKELRIQIDGLAELTKALKPINTKGIDDGFFQYLSPNINSKEIEKAVDSLYLAKAWLGKVLGELGEATPYANDGSRKTVDDIEPTADTNKTLTDVVDKYISETQRFSELNHIEKVDWLRQEIQNILEKTGCASKLQLQYFKENLRISKQSLGISKYLETYEQYLSEARFWLGFELERIHESSTNNI